MTALYKAAQNCDCAVQKRALKFELELMLMLGQVGLNEQLCSEQTTLQPSALRLRLVEDTQETEAIHLQKAREQRLSKQEIKAADCISSCEKKHP